MLAQVQREDDSTMPLSAPLTDRPKPSTPKQDTGVGWRVNATYVKVTCPLPFNLCPLPICDDTMVT